MTKMVKLSAVMVLTASAMIGCTENIGYDLAVTAGDTFAATIAAAFGNLISTLLFGVPAV